MWWAAAGGTQRSSWFIAVLKPFGWVSGIVVFNAKMENVAQNRVCNLGAVAFVKDGLTGKHRRIAGYRGATTNASMMPKHDAAVPGVKCHWFDVDKAVMVG